LIYCQPISGQDIQRAGLCAGVALEFRLPGPLLIENILLKLTTNAQQCLSSPNQCLALQFVEA